MAYAYIHKTWMEGTYDIPNKNPHFFVTTLGRDADNLVCFHNPKAYSGYIQVSSQFRKLLMLKVRL